jgi:hypothetical protein
MFGKKLEDFLYGNLDNNNLKEKTFFDAFLKYNPLLSTGCLINKLCWHMEDTVKTIKTTRVPFDRDAIMNILKGGRSVGDMADEKIKKMTELYARYKRHKEKMILVHDDGTEEKMKTMEQYNKVIRNQAYSISTNMAELATIAVQLCYNSESKADKGFAWNVFGEGIIDNILEYVEDTIYIPFLDDEGQIEYLGSHYSLYPVNVRREENYDYLV